MWVVLALVLLPGDGVPVTTVPVPNRQAVPMTLTDQQASTRMATLEQLREQLEPGEPPGKKASRLSEEEQRLVQQAFQRNFFSMTRQLPMKIRVTGRGECGLDPFRSASHPVGLEWALLQIDLSSPSQGHFLEEQKLPQEVPYSLAIRSMLSRGGTREL